jgi:hypothetical protein
MRQVLIEDAEKLKTNGNLTDELAEEYINGHIIAAKAKLIFYNSTSGLFSCTNLGKEFILTFDKNFGSDFANQVDLGVTDGISYENSAASVISGIISAALSSFESLLVVRAICELVELDWIASKGKASNG